jgi:hypothetical protein
MARKSWGALTPAYRRRLERGGVSQSAYESGASLKAARGHARTPEHRHKPKRIKPTPHRPEQWEVGNYNPAHVGAPLSATEIDSYQASKTPTPTNVLNILKNVQTTFTRLAVLYLAERYEAGQKREAGGTGGQFITLTWTGGRPATAHLRQLLEDVQRDWRGLGEGERDARMLDIAGQVVGREPDEAMKIIAWTVAESGPTQTRQNPTGQK